MCKRIAFIFSHDNPDGLYYDFKPCLQKTFYVIGVIVLAFVFIFLSYLCGYPIIQVYDKDDNVTVSGFLCDNVTINGAVKIPTDALFMHCFVTRLLYGCFVVIGIIVFIIGCYWFYEYIYPRLQVAYKTEEEMYLLTNKSPLIEQEQEIDDKDEYNA